MSKYGNYMLPPFVQHNVQYFDHKYRSNARLTTEPANISPGTHLHVEHNEKLVNLAIFYQQQRLDILKLNGYNGEQQQQVAIQLQQSSQQKVATQNHLLLQQQEAIQCQQTAQQQVAIQLHQPSQQQVATQKHLLSQEQVAIQRQQAVHHQVATQHHLLSQEQVAIQHHQSLQHQVGTHLQKSSQNQVAIQHQQFSQRQVGTQFLRSSLQQEYIQQQLASWQHHYHGQFQVGIPVNYGGNSSVPQPTELPFLSTNYSHQYPTKQLEQLPSAANDAAMSKELYMQRQNQHLPNEWQRQQHNSFQKLNEFQETLCQQQEQQEQVASSVVQMQKVQPTQGKLRENVQLLQQPLNYRNRYKNGQQIQKRQVLGSLNQTQQLSNCVPQIISAPEKEQVPPKRPQPSQAYIKQDLQSQLLQQLHTIAPAQPTMPRPVIRVKNGKIVRPSSTLNKTTKSQKPIATACTMAYDLQQLEIQKPAVKLAYGLQQLDKQNPAVKLAIGFQQLEIQKPDVEQIQQKQDPTHQQSTAQPTAIPKAQIYLPEFHLPELQQNIINKTANRSKESTVVESQPSRSCENDQIHYQKMCEIQNMDGFTQLPLDLSSRNNARHLNDNNTVGTMNMDPITLPTTPASPVAEMNIFNIQHSEGINDTYLLNSKKPHNKDEGNVALHYSDINTAGTTSTNPITATNAMQKTHSANDAYSLWQQILQNRDLVNAAGTINTDPITRVSTRGASFVATNFVESMETDEPNVASTPFKIKGDKPIFKVRLIRIIKKSALKPNDMSKAPPLPLPNEKIKKTIDRLFQGQEQYNAVLERVNSVLDRLNKQYAKGIELSLQRQKKTKKTNQAKPTKQTNQTNQTHQTRQTNQTKQTKQLEATQTIKPRRIVIVHKNGKKTSGDVAGNKVIYPLRITLPNGRPGYILGPGGTTITEAKYYSIEWVNAPTATRHVMQIIFTFVEMGSCTLTGKPSPAFCGRERPIKDQLDPIRVNDLIVTVMAKTNGKERQIRATITTKCADVAKKWKAMKLAEEAAALKVTHENSNVPSVE